MRVSEHLVHPTTVKLVKKGHPWITKDKFSLRFPKEADFIKAVDKNQKQLGHFLNDPSHPVVKARLWSFQKNFKPQDFWKEVKTRLEKAKSKRASAPSCQKRDNVIEVFQEGDGLPGLQVTRIKEHYIIQIHCSFWTTHKETLFSLLMKVFNENDLSRWWWQLRGQQQLPLKNLKDPTLKLDYQFSEYGVQYKAFLGSAYDFGIYTDMSSLRDQIKPHFYAKQKVLNLYSYTGAFSLYALHFGCEVISVDLSRKYIEILEKNIQLNHQTAPPHQSIVKPSLSVLKEMSAHSQDFIICDPPSASSDGKKQSSAIKDYFELIQEMDRVLKIKGKMLLFLNTHKISKAKFRSTLDEYFQKLNISSAYQMIESYGLREDCPTLNFFPEGNYLKGFLFQKLKLVE